MKVKLIQITQDPIDVMWTAARTCYSEKSPIEMWETRYPENIDLLDGYDNGEKEEIVNKHWNLVKKVLDSGHQSVAEHVYFTFAIEGISRACSHQLVRHRAGIVFSQQSQRYVSPKNPEDLYDFMCYVKTGRYNLIKEHELDKKVLGQELPETYVGEPIQAWCDNLLNEIFVQNENHPGFDNDKNILANSAFRELFYNAYMSYCKLQALGLKGEDARNVLPNATKTNITMSVNYRELIHLCNLRLCTRAQKEIRDLFKLIVKEVKNVDERLASYLVPQCEVLGLCTEHQCCGRKPKLSDIMKGYEEYNYYKNNITPCEFDTLSEDDYNMLMEAIKNPKVNQKLVEFMKQPNILD